MRPVASQKEELLALYARAKARVALGIATIAEPLYYAGLARRAGIPSSDLVAVGSHVTDQIEANSVRSNPRKRGRGAHPGHFPGKLGTGSRFAACEERVAAFYARKGRSVDPAAVCAAIGRRAYGPKKFKTLAVAGKRRKSR